MRSIRTAAAIELRTASPAAQSIRNRKLARNDGTMAASRRAASPPRRYDGISPAVKDRPITQTRFYFPPAVGSRLRRADFDDVVVFRAVQRNLGIKLSRAQIRVRAEIADEQLARALDYELGAPILATEMLYYSSTGEPVELTVSKNRGDQFSITYDAPNDLL